MCTRPKWSLDASLFFFRDAIQTFSSLWHWSSCIHANCTQMERQVSLKIKRITRRVFLLVANSCRPSVIFITQSGWEPGPIFCEMPPSSRNQHCPLSAQMFQFCAWRVRRPRFWSFSVMPCGHQGFFMATTYPLSTRPTFTEIDFFLNTALSESLQRSVLIRLVKTSVTIVLRNVVVCCRASFHFHCSSSCFS